MRTLSLLAAAALIVAAVPASGQQACPCVPLTHVWTVKTCADWNCAATELAVANGDPQVVAMPVGMSDQRWLIVRRFTSGAAIDSGADPFRLEQFDTMDHAVTRFIAIDTDHKPMMMTAPDGQVLVMSLRQAEPHHRAAAH